MDPHSSASFQKALKLSINSVDSNTESTPSPKSDLNSRISTLSEMQDLDTLIFLLKSALSHNEFSNLPSNTDTLRHLIHSICEEFRENPIKEVRLKNPEQKVDEDVTVNFMKMSSGDPINKIFTIPDNGVWLSKEDCRNVSALVIGALRDSASHGLKMKIRDLQEKVIGLAIKNNQLKQEARDKDFEIDHLIEVVDKLERKKVE